MCREPVDLKEEWVWEEQEEEEEEEEERCGGGGGGRGGGRGVGGGGGEGGEERGHHEGKEGWEEEGIQDKNDRRKEGREGMMITKKIYNHGFITNMVLPGVCDSGEFAPLCAMMIQL